MADPVFGVGATGNPNLNNPEVNNLNATSQIKFDLVNGVITSAKDIIAGGNSLADLAAQVAAIIAKLASSAWITSAMLSAGAVQAVHLNGQIVTTSLIDGAVTTWGENIWSGSWFCAPTPGTWSVGDGSSAPSGVWSAYSTNPNPSITSCALSVHKATDPITGHLLLDLSLLDFVTNAQIWIQIIDDLGNIVAGPTKLDIVYNASYTSLDLNQAGGHLKFSDTVGSRTFTAQIAVYGPSGASTSVTVTRADLYLEDKKK